MVQKVDDAEFIRLYHEGATPDELAAAFGVGVPQVRKVRARLGLPSFELPPGKPSKIDPDEFTRLFNEGMSRTQLADHFDTTTEYVSQFRRKLKLPPFPRAIRLSKTIELDEEVRVLVKNGATTKQICRELAVKPRSVERAKQRLRDAGLLPPAQNSGMPLPQEKVEQVDAMLEENASFNDIAETVGVSTNWLRRHRPGRAWTPRQVAEYRHMKEKLDSLA